MAVWALGLDRGYIYAVERRALGCHHKESLLSGAYGGVVGGWACLLHCKVAFRIVSCTPEPLPSASLQGLVEGLLVKDPCLLLFGILLYHRNRPAALPPVIFFPTCQVRVVRFYVGGVAPPPSSFFLLPPPSSSFFLAGSHLPALGRREPRRISSASS